MAVVLSIKGGNGEKRKPKPEGKGEFTRIATKTGDHWSAAMLLKGKYDGGFKESEKETYRSLKKKLMDSKLPDSEKKKLLSAFSSANLEDSWDGDETYIIINDRIKNEISENEAEHRIEAVSAYRKGKIAEYAKKYMEEVKDSDVKPEVKHGITRLLMIGADKGGLSAAVSVQKAIHYQFSEESAGKKLDGLEEISKIVIHL